MIVIRTSLILHLSLKMLINWGTQKWLRCKSKVPQHRENRQSLTSSLASLHPRTSTLVSPIWLRRTKRNNNRFWFHIFRSGAQTTARTLNLVWCNTKATFKILKRIHGAQVKQGSCRLFIQSTSMSINSYGNIEGSSNLRYHKPSSDQLSRSLIVAVGRQRKQPSERDNLQTV